ncbi:28S ribosomal protein S14, mitochondrial-like isoform X3 [Amphibalanus amphitrite]|uniref:28S ribosomal protein S14, mitochondrial-like isoform X2 n=1 Tax=Amphibalanus amphitrite TaxID=1232801 RepID=UPI001C91FFFB|nr:28S ribosomal protein S14, mitochondrial-like isoform X2 [Amphibalanus amphitrite]XP_043214003.1 28S ribosomal protein S14, mitochondrial-like isoform X3 [Amphibalanus amphitrite]
MASVARLKLSALRNGLSSVGLLSASAPRTTQVRTKYGDWRTIKDQAKRHCVRDFGIQRVRLNAVRKNRILPAELRELADREIADEPRNSNYVRTVDRCVATSRPRGVVQPWRLSRIMFRHLADYNQLSGVLRAKW